jgi:hypothetical protein
MKKLTELAIIASYALLTIILTYPLILHMDSLIIGLVGDAESHMWSYWWMNKALTELHTNPYYTQWLYYPEGVSLYFYAYNVVHAVLSIPLQSVMSLTAVYNLTEMLGFVGAAYASYWLAYDVTGSKRAGYIAGIAYAFAPIQVFHFNLGQPNLHGVEFIPLYIMSIRRWLQPDGHYRWLLGAVIALALSSYSDWQFAVYLQLVTGVVLLGALLTHPLKQWGRVIWQTGWRTAAVEGLYTLTVAPVVFPMIQELSGPRPYMFRSRRDTVYHAPDLLSYFIPNPEHPLWRSWAVPLADSLKTPGILLATVSISYVVLVLAVYGAIRHWNLARFWVWCGLIFMIFSLGPQLRVLGETTTIPLPYEVLFQFKIIQVTRAPARYFVITALCMAVLAAIGTRALLSRYAPSFPAPAPIPGRGGGTPARSPLHPLPSQGSFLLIIVLLCFELLPAPVNADPAAALPAFLTDGTLDQAGALMEWPDAGNRSMYYAAVHEHPVMYGEMSRDNPPGPLLNYLRKGPFHEEIIDTEVTWRCLTNAYHITHLIVYHDEKYHKPLPVQERHTIQQQFLPTLTLVQASPIATLYKLPAGSKKDTCLTVGKGWSDPRHFGPDEPLYRWMGQRGTLGLHRKEPGRALLHFHAHSFAIPRQVEVILQGETIATLTINAREPFTLELDLPAGLNWLELRSVEPATSPADYGYDETDPVSIGLSEVWVELYE